MPEYSSLVNESIYFSSPSDIFSIIGWGILFVAIIYFLHKNWETISLSFKINWVLYSILACLTPLLVVVGGFKLQNVSSLPLPILPGEAQIPILLLFSTIPWQLAGGMLGIGPAFILGIISGVSVGSMVTHDFATILEIASLSLLFSVLVRQNYRSNIFSAIRIPIVASFVTGIIIFPIFVINRILSVSGNLASRIDYGLNQSMEITLIRIGELLIGGLIVSIFYFLKSRLWKYPKTLQPSPIEKKFENRFLLSVFPAISFVILVLLVSDWQVAGGAAKQLVEDRLRNISEITAESIPYFLEAGQNQALALADPALFDLNNEIEEKLSQKLKLSPFFKLIFVFDNKAQPYAGYPYPQIDNISISEDELAGVELALQGVDVQTYVGDPWINEDSAQISFVVSIKNENGQPIGVLLTRTDLISNPFTQSALETLRNITSDGGEGIILDEHNRILFKTTSASSEIFSVYQGLIPESNGIFESFSPQAQRQIMYLQPIVGSGWKVIVGTPVQVYQDLALKIAAPLFILLIIIFFVVFILLKLSLRPITNTLKTLSSQASLISQGNLENPVIATSEDEFGQLANSFEQMRLKLKNRLGELNHLLITSQSIGEHLEINESISRLLESALVSGGDFARVVLTKDVVPEHVELPYLAIGVGEENEAILALDKQLFENLKNQDKLIIPNLARMRRFVTPIGSKVPGALLAISLHHENKYYGVLWVGYQESRLISDEEIRFISTLASQTGMAAANAKLYATAELGRQRMEAVINSTPEPVMVFDDNDRLILMNPAAMQLRGLVNSTNPGESLREVISNEILYDLLKSYSSNRDVTREIQLSNDRTYYTSISSVMNNNRMVGKVCLLRDITHFRVLDTLKTDVVATVSHDLRSPLTFMKGYVSLLTVVGQLNDQQKSYVEKIEAGIGSMTKLVNNLLDLGRIEAGIGQSIEKISPNLIIDQIISGLQPMATQKNIQLSFGEAEYKDLLIDADPELLQQAIFNLVDNAIKYTNLGGKVDVILTSREGKALFEIRDTGMGIAPIDLPHLFDKFYRSSRRESYKHRGSGLGLAIVKTIAERHFGRVWVESKLGRGSSFYLEIPIEHVKLPLE